MATSNTTNIDTKAEDTGDRIQSEESPLKRFTTSSAMALLWEKTSAKMTLQELDWFADGATEQVSTELRALSDVLENTACMVQNDEGTGSFQDSASTSSLLFNLHNQLSIIAELADIASEAGHFARRARKNTKAA
jgi:hypothetical protein